jgi:hypothetical protein
VVASAIPRQPLHHVTPSLLILVIDVDKRLPRSVPNAVAFGGFVDFPWVARMGGDQACRNEEHRENEINGPLGRFRACVEQPGWQLGAQFSRHSSGTYRAQAEERESGCANIFWVAFIL